MLQFISFILLLLFSFSFSACTSTSTEEKTVNNKNSIDLQNEPHIYVLGVAQDGGFPQAGCVKQCCEKVWVNDSLKIYVASLAIIDPVSGERWIIDATHDFREQLKMLDTHFGAKNKYGINGIFLTHGHIGHYTGIMQLGREAMGAQNIPVYSMPRMYDYLRNNGPWDQLVNLKNIDLKLLKEDSTIQLNSRISISPFLVPHRDEYTETVGYMIRGPKYSVLFIPDIDKWEKWNRNIEDYISKCDYAFLDGTFYNSGEIPGRNMKDIPHPFVKESMDRFKRLSGAEKKKVHFIHFNHTNPLMNLPESDTSLIHVLNNGFNIARQGMSIVL